jgi:hypothetical protein
MQQFLHADEGTLRVPLPCAAGWLAGENLGQTLIPIEGLLMPLPWRNAQASLVRLDVVTPGLFFPIVTRRLGLGKVFGADK